MIASLKGAGSMQVQYVHDFRKGGFLQMLDTGAEYLGMPEEQLRERLKGGKSLVEIAEAQGKPADGLKDALLLAFPQAQQTDQLSAVIDRMMIERIRPRHVPQSAPEVADPGTAEASTAVNLMG